LRQPGSGQNFVQSPILRSRRRRRHGGWSVVAAGVATATGFGERASERAAEGGQDNAKAFCAPASCQSQTSRRLEKLSGGWQLRKVNTAVQSLVASSGRDESKPFDRNESADGGRYIERRRGKRQKASTVSAAPLVDGEPTRIGFNKRSRC